MAGKKRVKRQPDKEIVNLWAPIPRKEKDAVVRRCESLSGLNQKAYLNGAIRLLNALPDEVVATVALFGPGQPSFDQLIDKITVAVCGDYAQETQSKRA